MVNIAIDRLFYFIFTLLRFKLVLLIVNLSAFICKNESNSLIQKKKKKKTGKNRQWRVSASQNSEVRIGSLKNANFVERYHLFVTKNNICLSKQKQKIII